jgi:hypothetical protein
MSLNRSQKISAVKKVPFFIETASTLLPEYRRYCHENLHQIANIPLEIRLSWGYTAPIKLSGRGNCP